MRGSYPSSEKQYVYSTASGIFLWITLKMVLLIKYIGKGFIVEIRQEIFYSSNALKIVLI